jgi:hypothetical protein
MYENPPIPFVPKVMKMSGDDEGAEKTDFINFLIDPKNAESSYSKVLSIF